MPLLLLAAVSGLACATPAHRDGASIRCNEAGNVMVLQGITVSPPGGPCFRPDDCAADLGRMAQDHLAELTRGRAVVCNPAGRGKVRCTAGKADLSCAMIASGLAKPDGTALGCAVGTGRPVKLVVKPPVSPLAALEPYRNWLIAYLAAINILTFAAFLEDRRRATSGLNRIADFHLLGLALFGGSLGGFIAQQTTGHLRDDEPFASQFIVLLGLQVGGAIGLFAIPLG